MRPLIALLTDFGLSDPYVGMMKAVIKTINPEAEIIDITHDVPKYNIRLGAHILKVVSKYLPPNAIVVGVVDPGVGSERRSVILTSKKHVYVGPDNGLLISAAMKEGLNEAYVINEKIAGLPNPSPTFHGRDIFAPAAAWISKGVRPDSLGVRIDPNELVMVDTLPKPVTSKGNIVGVEVVHIDGFGNIITSASLKQIMDALSLTYGSRVDVSADGVKWYPAEIVKSFSHVSRGSFAVYQGSYELAEVAVFMGSAAEVLRPAGRILLRNPALSNAESNNTST